MTVLVSFLVVYSWIQLLLIKPHMSQTINNMVASNPYKVSIWNWSDFKGISVTELKITSCVLCSYFIVLRLWCVLFFSVFGSFSSCVFNFKIHILFFNSVMLYIKACSTSFKETPKVNLWSPCFTYDRLATQPKIASVFPWWYCCCYYYDLLSFIMVVW